MPVDTHLHSAAFSGDGHQSYDEIFRGARQSGLEGVCLTDHFDEGISYQPGREEIFPLDDYFARGLPYRRMSERASPHFYLGIELGYRPQSVASYRRIVASHPFDQVIQSAHLIGDRDLFVDQALYEPGKKVVYRLYLEEMIRMIKAQPDFDIVGHFDYVSRYTPFADAKMRYQELPEAFDTFFKTLIAENKCLELNASSVAAMQRLGYEGKDALPDEGILRAYRRLGGRKVSLGSDAHYRPHLGRFFDLLTDQLRSLGFEALTHYVHRQPQSSPLG